MIRYTMPVTTMDDVRRFAKELPINEVVIAWLDTDVASFRVRLAKTLNEVGVDQYVTKSLNKKEIAVIIIDQNA